MPSALAPTGWLLLLLGMCGRARTYDCSLHSVTAMDASCPRYIYMFTSVKAGFGDHLVHLYTLLAAACHLGRTVVIDGDFGHTSVHQMEGYTEDFQFIGTATLLPRYSTYVTLNHYRDSHITVYPKGAA